MKNKIILISLCVFLTTILKAQSVTGYWYCSEASYYLTEYSDRIVLKNLNNNVTTIFWYSQAVRGENVYNNDIDFLYLNINRKNIRIYDGYSKRNYYLRKQAQSTSSGTWQPYQGGVINQQPVVSPRTPTQNNQTYTNSPYSNSPKEPAGKGTGGGTPKQPTQTTTGTAPKPSQGQPRPVTAPVNQNPPPRGRY